MMSARTCPFKNAAHLLNAAVDAHSGYRFQNPSSPTRSGPTHKADNCGGELVNQAAFP